MNILLLVMAIICLFLIHKPTIFAQDAGLRLSKQQLAALNAKKATLEQELSKRIEEINAGKAKKLTPQEAVDLANKQTELAELHAKLNKNK